MKTWKKNKKIANYVSATKRQTADDMNTNAWNDQMTFKRFFVFFDKFLACINKIHNMKWRKIEMILLLFLIFLMNDDLIAMQSQIFTHLNAILYSLGKIIIDWRSSSNNVVINATIVHLYKKKKNWQSKTVKRHHVIEMKN